LDASIREVLTVEGAIASRTTSGGTAPSEVRKQISAAMKKTMHQRTEIANKSKAFSEMMKA
jgi:argininosuccinate lyase